MDELNIKEDINYSVSFSDIKGSVFVVFSTGVGLDNVIGVFSSPQNTIEALYEHFTLEQVVVRLEHLESLELDGEAIIATKLVDPEVRVALCSVDPGGGGIVVS